MSLYFPERPSFEELPVGTRSAMQGESSISAFIVIPQVLENFNAAAEQGSRSWKTEAMISRMRQKDLQFPAGSGSPLSRPLPPRAG